MRSCACAEVAEDNPSALAGGSATKKAYAPGLSGIPSCHGPSAGLGIGTAGQATVASVGIKRFHGVRFDRAESAAYSL